MATTATAPQVSKHWPASIYRRPDGGIEICLLIKLAGEATASRRRAVNRASEKRGKLARFVDLLERGDKHDSDLDHCSDWTKARLILRVPAGSTATAAWA